MSAGMINITPQGIGTIGIEPGALGMIGLDRPAGAINTNRGSLGGISLPIFPPALANALTLLGAASEFLIGAGNDYLLGAGGGA